MKSLFLILLYCTSFFNLFAQNIGCNDDDVTISTGLSIWTEVNNCSEAYAYMQTLELDCLSELNLPFVSAEPITFAEICCETCQDQFVYGCTNPVAVNYNPDANTDDGSCIYPVFGCTDPAAGNYNPNATDDNESCDYSPWDFSTTDCNMTVLLAGDLDITVESEVLSGSIWIGITDADGNVYGSTLYSGETTSIAVWGEGDDVPGMEPGETLNFIVSTEDGDVVGTALYNLGNGIYSCNGLSGVITINFSSSIEIEGCTDLAACNYDENATVDDGSCEYGVECLISPCISSEDPGVEGAYCIDDYCEDCCAIWYYSDGTIISNSCDNVNSNSMIGLWYDFDADQYIEITDSVIGFYTYLDDPNFNCWYYWSMDYTNLGISPITGVEMIEFIDEKDGPIQLSVIILDNGNLQLGDDQGDGVELSPINELPELEMCSQNPTSEGCEDFLGQWTYLNYAYIIIDEEGAKFMIPSDESDIFCYDSFELSYSQLNDSDTCQLFIAGNGIAFDFAQISLNDDGTLSLESNISDDFPSLWDQDDSDLSSLEYCIYGCVDMLACNFDPFANSDNGTCGIIDDCGDCQIPYCLYDGEYIDYVDEENCGGVWIGNNCENNDYCLSGSADILWNSGCSISLDEIKSNLNSISRLNILGQTIKFNDFGFQFIIYDNGLIEKKYLLSNE